jgi:hypothetical protein
VAARSWVAARNARTGRTLLFTGARGEAQTRVVGEDWGRLGAHAGALAAFRLRPGELRSTLAYLAVARDEAEAEAFGALAAASSLP